MVINDDTAWDEAKSVHFDLTENGYTKEDIIKITEALKVFNGDF